MARCPCIKAFVVVEIRPWIRSADAAVMV